MCNDKRQEKNNSNNTNNSSQTSLLTWIKKAINQTLIMVSVCGIMGTILFSYLKSSLSEMEEKIIRSNTEINEIKEEASKALKEAKTSLEKLKSTCDNYDKLVSEISNKIVNENPQLKDNLTALLDNEINSTFSTLKLAFEANDVNSYRVCSTIAYTHFKNCLSLLPKIGSPILTMKYYEKIVLLHEKYINDSSYTKFLDQLETSNIKFATLNFSSLNNHYKGFGQKHIMKADSIQNGFDYYTFQDDNILNIDLNYCQIVKQQMVLKDFIEITNQLLLFAIKRPDIVSQKSLNTFISNILPKVAPKLFHINISHIAFLTYILCADINRESDIKAFMTYRKYLFPENFKESLNIFIPYLYEVMKAPKHQRMSQLKKTIAEWNKKGADYIPIKIFDNIEENTIGIVNNKLHIKTNIDPITIREIWQPEL